MTVETRMNYVLAIICLASVLIPCRADPVVVTRAMTASTIIQIHVERESIRTELEIGASNLLAFTELLPDEIFTDLTGRSEPYAQRVQSYLRDQFVIEADGKPLVGEIESLEIRKRVRRDVVTGMPLPAMDEAETVIFITLRLVFQGQPDSLTLRAPHTESGGAAANIGFVLYHLGVPTLDFRYMPGEATIDLDWDDPWYSKFRHRNLRRQFDSPLMTFLYVEPLEVRKEIVVRPMDLQRWVDLGLEGASTIPIERQAEIKRLAEEFFKDKGVVTIDGRLVEPIVDRVDFIRRTLRLTGVIDPPEELSLASATLGVIFVYPVTDWPERVEMAWDVFDDRIQSIPAFTTDEAGSLPVTITPDRPNLVWENLLTNPSSPGLIPIEPPPAPTRVTIPVVSAFLAIALVAVVGVQLVGPRRGGSMSRRRVMLPATVLVLCAVTLPIAHRQFTLPGTTSGVDQDGARRVLSDLLTNVYRAFDFREDEQIYDTLERSTTGEMLEQVYTMIHGALLVQSQTGVRVRVRDVEIVDLEHEPIRGGVGFTARCVWNVSGSVGHWGHTHMRVSQYEADLTVEAVEGEWRITTLTPIRQERVSQLMDRPGSGAGVQIVRPIVTEVTAVGMIPPDDRPGRSVVSRWRVMGVVYRGGHSHTNLNEYQAENLVIRGYDGWRIGRSKTIEQFRVDSAPGETFGGAL